MAHCPRCLVEHLRPPEGEHLGRACRACRGAWLPALAAQRLIADPFGPLADLPRLPTGNHALRCPGCRAELERRRVADIEIDVCPGHGAWFDHQEIDRIRGAAEHHRRGRPGLHRAEFVAAAVAVAVAQQPPNHASQSDEVAVELAVEAADVAVSAVVAHVDTAVTTVEAAAGSGDVAVAVLEVVDVGEVGGGALELLSSALEALFSGL